MSEFQLILSILALVIFIIFFKQLFSGNYPKRGLDFDSSLKNENIGGISRPDKIFKNNQTNSLKQSRVNELLDIAQKALDDKNSIEAKKALESLLIIKPDNIDAMRMLAIAKLNMNDFISAKDTLEELLKISPNDDLAHNLLANTLHKLGEDEEALNHHKIAVDLDNSYAPYYYNWANTLYDLKEYQRALELYNKAVVIDPGFDEAKKMKEEIENGRY